MLLGLVADNRGAEIWEGGLGEHFECQNLLKIILDLGYLLLHTYISKYLNKGSFFSDIWERYSDLKIQKER